METKCYWKDIECTNGMYCGGCEHQPPDDEKKNGKESSKEVIYFDYGMPMCPSCKEPTYSDERCVFCGQKLIMPEIKKPEPEIKGGHYNEAGSLVCDKCGSDKLRFVAHADGRDFYRNTYNCENRHCINVKIYR